MAPNAHKTFPLPTRDGVGASVVALPPGGWPTLFAFLVQRFPNVSEATWAARIAAGEVVDAQGVPVTLQRSYEAHTRLFYYRALADEPRLNVEERVLFHDAHLLVADKPHFLPVTPGGHHVQQTLLVRLKRKLGLDTLVPLHRLDRETAGLVMFSTDPATRGRYQALFRERRVDKVYEAITHWPAAIEDEPALPLTRRSRIARGEHFMQMREEFGEPNAETRIELLARRGAFAHLRLVPLTGRTHQLRVHCAALGRPICNDTLYPRLLPHGSDDLAKPLQLLARSLAFTDPLSGARRSLVSGLSLLGLDAACC